MRRITRRGQPVADPNRMSGTFLPVWLRFCHPSPDYSQAVVARRRKRRWECVAPRRDRDPRRCTLALRSVSRFIDMATFADGACEARSRSKEKAMQGHRRRRATQRSPVTPISPKGGGGTASISLSLLLHDVSDIASSSLRELAAVALATNSTLSMKRGTKEIEGGAPACGSRSPDG